MSELWQESARDPLRGFRILRIGLNPPREQALCANQLAGPADVCRRTGGGDENLLERFGSGEKVMALDSLGYRQATQFYAGKSRESRRWPRHSKVIAIMPSGR